MQINFHGLSCLSITAKPLAGDVTIALDPYDNSTGLRFPRTLSADVVFSSQDTPAHNNIAGVGGTPFVLDFPGEYEVKGLMMDARVAKTKVEPKHRVLRFAAEGITVGFLGALDRALETAELALMEGVDILLIPVGGGAVMTPKLAAEVVRQIEPRVVIPMHYSEKGLKEKLQPLSAFQKEMGSIRTEEVTKFKVTKGKLPQDDMLLVVLSR